MLWRNARWGLFIDVFSISSFNFIKFYVVNAWCAWHKMQQLSVLHGECLSKSGDVMYICGAISLVFCDFCVRGKFNEVTCIVLRRTLPLVVYPSRTDVCFPYPSWIPEKQCCLDGRVVEQFCRNSLLRMTVFDEVVPGERLSPCFFGGRRCMESTDRVVMSPRGNPVPSQ